MLAGLQHKACIRNRHPGYLLRVGPWLPGHHWFLKPLIYTFQHIHEFSLAVFFLGQVWWESGQERWAAWTKGSWPRKCSSHATETHRPSVPADTGRCDVPGGPHLPKSVGPLAVAKQSGQCHLHRGCMSNNALSLSWYILEDISESQGSISAIWVCFWGTLRVGLRSYMSIVLGPVLVNMQT